MLDLFETMKHLSTIAFALCLGLLPATAGIEKAGSAGKRERVRALLAEAVGFMGTGRYDLARKRCDQALTVDPFNIQAREVLEKIQSAEISRLKKKLDASGL